MRKFRKFVMMNKDELKRKLERILKGYYKRVVNGDGFLYAKGSEKCPILLTAHMDTVHKETVKRIDILQEDGNTIISSPQGIGGDDRCGVWLIYKILSTTKYRPSILFCEDEEIGGVGSSKFTDTDYIEDLAGLKYLVELDRANSDDAVFYDCGNKEFQEYIQKVTGYKLAYGSFSDIGHLSPACDRASVNLSCGYYNQHTLTEYVVFEEMQVTLEKVKLLLADAGNCESYDYQEYDRYFRNRHSTDYWYSDYWRKKYSYYYDDDDEDDSKVETVIVTDPEPEKKSASREDAELSIYTFWFYTVFGAEECYVCNASNLAEAVGQLLMTNSNITWNDVVDYTVR